MAIWRLMASARPRAISATASALTPGVLQIGDAVGAGGVQVDVLDADALFADALQAFGAGEVGGRDLGQADHEAVGFFVPIGDGGVVPADDLGVLGGIGGAGFEEGVEDEDLHFCAWGKSYSLSGVVDEDALEGFGVAGPAGQAVEGGAIVDGVEGFHPVWRCAGRRGGRRGGASRWRRPGDPGLAAMRARAMGAASVKPGTWEMRWGAESLR